MEFELTNHSAEDVMSLLQKLSERNARNTTHEVDKLMSEHQGYTRAINDVIEALIREKE